MGDSHTGGGGSVQWKINVRDLKREGKEKPSNGRTIVTGADITGDIGDDFTITIKLPAGMSLQDFINGLNWRPGSVSFDLRVTDDPRQITIHWPD